MQEKLQAIIAACKWYDDFSPTITDPTLKAEAAWWHEWAMRAAEIRFLRGRLRFGESKTGAPFPSVVLVYRNGSKL